MKLQDNLKKHKRLIGILVIFLCIGLVEIAANYHAIVNGYEAIDLSGNILLEKDKNNQKYVISYENKEGIYVKQLRLDGNFDGVYKYTIKTEERNAFDKVEDGTYTDTVNAWFNNFYTDINKKIVSLEITLNKEDECELTSAFITNEIEINKYRMLFVGIALLLFYCIFFEKQFLQRIERFFLIYALSFGLLTICIAQTERVGWDEEIHFRNVYSIASGKNVEWTEAALAIKNNDTAKCNTKIEYAMLRDYMDQIGTDEIVFETKETAAVSYSKTAYIPQAVFLKIGMILKLPFSYLYAFGKLGNLFVYILIMFYAIRKAKQKKLLLCFFAMMPTVLFQASSYTYDSVVTSFVTVGCVLWGNAMFFSEEGTWKECILAVLLLTIGSLSKAVYIPIAMIMLLLPQFCLKNKKDRAYIYIGIMAIVGLVMMTFVLPTISSTFSGDLAYGADSRGGDTSVVGQLISMVKHPLSSIELMVRNVLQFDNFRNLGNTVSDSFFFGNLMFLNFAMLGTLPDKWCIVLVVMLLLLLFYEEKGQKKELVWSKGYRLYVGIILLGTVFLIWLSLYLSFTPVGEANILGVQARYYLPVVYLSALLVSNRKIKIRGEYDKMAKMTLISASALEIIAFYELAFVGRLL